MSKIKDELQDLPDDLKLKLAKYMYVHEPEHFDKRVNGKPKEKKKPVPLIKFESTLDAHLRDRSNKIVTALKNSRKRNVDMG
jgi:hypothetical protein